MRPVKLRDLELGQTVASDVRNLNGQVIVAAGTVLAPRLQAILKAWGIVEVMVEGNSPDAPLAAEPQAAVAAGEGLEEPRAGEAPGHPALVEIMKLASRLKAKPAESPAVLPPPAAHRGRPSRPTPSLSARERWRRCRRSISRLSGLLTIPPVRPRISPRC